MNYGRLRIEHPGLFWTVIEDEPGCFRKIASFKTEEDARYWVGAVEVCQVLNDLKHKPKLQRLEAWMREITDLLCYQPEIPLAHKTEIQNAMIAFSKEIENP